MLLMTKLKNELRKYDAGYECHLRNFSINGQKRGCSGFIRNPENGLIVYVNTEESFYLPMRGLALIRYADSLKDYRGRFNNYAPYADVAAVIHSMLQRPPEAPLSYERQVKVGR